MRRENKILCHGNTDYGKSSAHLDAERPNKVSPHLSGRGSRSSHLSLGSVDAKSFCTGSMGMSQSIHFCVAALGGYMLGPKGKSKLCAMSGSIFV